MKPITKRLSRWVHRKLSGHVRMGPVTVYGANAMHFAINVRTPLGHVCARPTTGRGAWRWYFYVSHNATPWGAWLAVGPGVESDDRRRANARRALALAWLSADDERSRTTLERIADGDALQ